MDIKKSLGVKIKDLRRKNGYTQEMFAELIGVAPRHISRIENGVNTPAIETLGRIAKCLNVEVKELFNFPSFHDEEYLKINDVLEGVLKKYEVLVNQKNITINNYILDENIYIGKTALKIILSNLISNAIKYTDVNGVINIGIVDDWLYIENSYGNNRISNMDEIFDVKFDLNKENSNGLGLYIVSNILNNYNIEYKALQDEEFFIFKIKIFS